MLQTTPLFADAKVEKHNLHQLNKTRIRFKIGLKNASKRVAPKWSDVLDASSSASDESDLEKITKSEVGLKGISVFKALDDAAKQLRQEIEDVQSWMIPDNGDWIATLEVAPLVWDRMLYIRDAIAPSLRQNLQEQYSQGYSDTCQRVEKFLSAKAWEMSDEDLENAKEKLLAKYPSVEEIEDYLQVVIGRPVIIPALKEQLSEQQADCLQQIAQFIKLYDSNLEQRLREAAIAGGEQLAAELLEELAAWEPGKKPVNFKKKLEKHLRKIEVLISNASPEAGGTLQEMMSQIEQILNTASVDAKKLSNSGRSALQEKMDSLRSKLLGEQQKLLEVSSEMGLSKATVMSLKLR